MTWNTHIPKFRRFVLQNFPFIEEDFDALTDYELICKVIEYLNQVITSQNEVIAEVGRFETDVNNEIDEFKTDVNNKIDEFETNITNNFNRLEGLFNDLKSFVDNYFDNLDVQEEINNKLEQMTEDGTLQEIITTYIQSNVAWTFDSVSEMLSSTNLIAGSYATTFGFYSVNDGGGANYIIREPSEGETPNNITTFSIGSLIAELVLDDDVKLSQLGAKTSDTDSSAYLNYAITNYKKICIDKEYKFTTSIVITNNDKEIYGYGQQIEWNGSGYLFEIIDKNRILIHDLKIKCLNSNNGIYLHGNSGNGVSDVKISNLNLINAQLGINATFTWDSSFDNVRLQSCNKPLELGSQTNNLVFTSCKFVSFTSKITTSNSEGVLFNSCDIANYSGNGPCILLFQTGITFLNCYYENLGLYPANSSNISVQNSTGNITNLNIIGGKVTQHPLYVNPANAKVFATQIYEGNIVILPYNAASDSTDNPAVAFNVNSLDMQLGINRFNAVCFFDGKNDVTLEQYSGGTLTQTFGNGIKQLSHTSESSAGIKLPMETNSIYILIIEAKLPAGISQLIFRGNGSGSYNVGRAPINNRWILPLASKDSTELRILWETSGIIELSELKMIKVA